ncbi:MAG: hypothetical protein ACOZFS_14750 [Thermodesulfobacteriota bacterium]
MPEDSVGVVGPAGQEAAVAALVVPDPADFASARPAATRHLTSKECPVSR